MPRRKPYTKVIRTNEIRADHVKGMGDVIFKGFQCLNCNCTEYIFIRKDDLVEEFEITCPSCGFTLRYGDESIFYDYTLVYKQNNSIIEEGEFSILHDDYIAEAKEYKYCIICNTLKPIEFFDKHEARKSKRQGECRLCKKVYNTIKNQSRLSDQHREASQKRRLYVDLAGGEKINSRLILDRFNYRCFKCGKDLSDITDPRERPLDHTLPVYYLYPLTTENATLLCKEHNAEKAGKWPSEYYSPEELRRLALNTGILFEILAGRPCYNPDAIARLRTHEFVEQLLIRYIPYETEIIKLRNRILAAIGFDFFEHANISPALIRRADAELKTPLNEPNTEPDTDET